MDGRDPTGRRTTRRLIGTIVPVFKENPCPSFLFQSVLLAALPLLLLPLPESELRTLLAEMAKMNPFRNPGAVLRDGHRNLD